MATARPIYTTLDSVKARLANKVQFQRRSGTVDEGEMSDDLLAQLVVDAETEVEQDLRSRYWIPFTTDTDQPYRTLPDHSQRAIRMAVDMRAVVLILETDFGRGTHINADGYIAATSTHYESYIQKLLGRNKEGQGDKIDRYRFSPPIEGLKLAKHNREADDGYRGMIINTDQMEHDSVSVAIEQVSGRIPLVRRGRFPGTLR